MDGNRINYTAADAVAYGSLEISGTTYEIGYNYVADLLGDLSQLSVLDYGAGAGRSSRFLRRLGARQVYALDRSQAMIDAGSSQNLHGIRYLLSRGGEIPLGDKSMDLAVSFFVFIEFITKEEMAAACREVGRVLKSRKRFVVLTINPEAFGRTYKTLSYEEPAERRAGERALCRLETGQGILELLDTYWTVDDYCEALASGGFSIVETAYPVATKRDFPETGESVIAPFVIIDARKDRI